MAHRRFAVELTQGAEDDLDSIWAYLIQNSSRAIAEELLDALMDKGATLQSFPMRGDIPSEFEGLGIKGIRQIHMRPYRLIYRIEGSKVLILAIADGRRDTKSMLEARLLAG
jgi:toxin ParE1/3/4